MRSSIVFHCRLSILLVCSLLLIASAQAGEPMRLNVHPDALVVMDGDAQIAKYSIEIAATEPQRSAGLMFRTDLPKDRGMLFVFGDSAERFFWMQNTPTPLDIIYAASNGTIVHIARNTTPFSRTAIPSRFPARFAFEIHAGQAEYLSIKAGQRLIHPVISKK